MFPARREKGQTLFRKAVGVAALGGRAQQRTPSTSKIGGAQNLFLMFSHQ